MRWYWLHISVVQCLQCQPLHNLTSFQQKNVKLTDWWIDIKTDNYKYWWKSVDSCVPKADVFINTPSYYHTKIIGHKYVTWQSYLCYKQTNANRASKQNRNQNQPHPYLKMDPWARGKRKGGPNSPHYAPGWSTGLSWTKSLQREEIDVTGELNG